MIITKFSGEKNNRAFFKIEKNGTTLIDSSHGPILFEDQYLEISLELGSYNCYGLGKMHNINTTRSVSYDHKQNMNQTMSNKS